MRANGNTLISGPAKHFIKEKLVLIDLVLIHIYSARARNGGYLIRQSPHFDRLNLMSFVK